MTMLASAAIFVTSAGATTLCKEAAGAGSCVLPYGSGTELVAESSESVFKSSSWTVTCTKSVLTGKTLEDGTEAGKALKAEVSGLTFAGCKTSGGTECTVSAVNLAYEASLSWTSGNNGTLTLSKAGIPNPGGTIKCGALISCTYSKENVELSVAGGNPATASLSKAELVGSGEGCPATATWTGTYSLKEPEEAMFVANQPEPPTVLCTEKASPCKKPFGFVTIEGNLVNPPGATFEWNAKVQNTCAQSTWEGKTEVAGAPLVGKLLKLSFAKCTCTTTVANRLPWRLEIYALSAPFMHDGTIGNISGGTGKPQIEITCAGKTCKWMAFGVPSSFVGGSPAKIEFTNAQFMEEVAGCGTLKLVASYSLVKPTPVWVEH